MPNGLEIKLLNDKIVHFLLKYFNELKLKKLNWEFIDIVSIELAFILLENICILKRQKCI
jgi:hypothetical protein